MDLKPKHSVFESENAIMSNAKSSWSKWSMIGLTVVALAAFAIPALGQEAAKTSAPGGGYVDDWSAHHVVFSNPGTAQEAIQAGHYAQWLKITSDPRYIMQQLKRNSAASAPAVSGVDSGESVRAASPAAPGAEDAQSLLESLHPGSPDPITAKRKPLSPIKKDWSMISGGQASLTVNVTGNDVVGGSSTVTINVPGAQMLTASAPVAEVWTVVYSTTNAPAANSSLTIGNVTYEFEATPLSTPTSGCYVAAVDGTTGATDLYDAVNKGTTSESNTTYECATGVGANGLVTATQSTNTVTLTAKTAGSVGFTFTPSGTTHFTNTETADPSDGTVSGTSFKYTTNGVADTAAQLAADLVTAIKENATVTGLLTVVANGADITFTAITAGTTANGYSVAEANFADFTGTGNLTGGATATTVANAYPAKYSFSTTNANCASSPPADYVVYPTGLAGSATQATIVGYDNLYSSCSGTVPSVSWAYNTGGTATLSPVISLKGDQVAYIQSEGTNAYLVILTPLAGSGGAVGAPTFGTGAGLVSNSSYRGCTAPCYTTIELSGGPNDTNSSPFYVYSTADTLYVGDNIGKLHQFTGVFLGTPGEVIITGSWPISVSGNVLTSPVFDAGTSGNIFVADSGGFLYSYKASAIPPTHEMTSSKLTYASGTVGIVDGPLVDPSTEEVYVFVGDDANTNTGVGCDSTTGCSGVFQFAAGNTTKGTGACTTSSTTSWNGGGTNCGVESVFGTGTTTTPTIYDGTFDHIYYAGTGTTGNLWTCSANASSEPRLSYVPLATGFSNAAVNVAETAIAGLTSATATCSPVTEIYGSNGTTDDYIYLSVTASGTQTACSGACLYNFEVSTNGTSTTVPGSATAGINETGGTSGIIIDNTGATASGESQIYFGSLGAETCGGNTASPVVGAGTGNCTVQALQTTP
jgi:hypothetical protein